MYKNIRNSSSFLLEYGGFEYTSGYMYPEVKNVKYATYKYLQIEASRNLELFGKVGMEPNIFSINNNMTMLLMRVRKVLNYQNIIRPDFFLNF